MTEGKIVLLVIASIFAIIAIIMAIISMLLIYNYTIVSIQLKQRNIGIMRSLGASKKDVFNIFFTESIILACINSIIAIILSFLVITLLNVIFVRNYLGYSFSILKFGITSILSIIIVSFIVTIIVSIKPIIKFSKKVPIDIIKGI